MPPFSARRSLVVLALLAGCGADRARSPHPSPLIESTPAASAECARADALEAEAEASARSGNLLRARRLAERAHAECSSATRALEQVREALTSSTGEPAELLAAAASARTAGELEHARKAESAAVALLEKKQGEGLSLVQRWSADRSTALETSPFVVSSWDQQISILDARNGNLHARIPLPPGIGKASHDHEVELDPSGERLLLLSIDLSAAQEPLPACMSRLQIFDGHTSKKLGEECATDRAFSADGSRLAIARLVGWGDGAIMRVVVLDAKTLKPVIELPEPGNVSNLAFAPDGVTLAVNWSHRVSLTNVRTGKTESWVAAREDFPSSVVFGGKFAAWRMGGKAWVFDLAEDRLSSVPLGACENPGDLVLSPSGKRLATECGDAFTLWDLSALPRPARRLRQTKAPPDYGLFDESWMPDDRGLIVELVRDSHGEKTLYDTLRRSWVALAGKGEKVSAIDARSRLVIVEKARGIFDGRLLHLDASLQPKPVALPNCGPSDIVTLDDSTALVSCHGKEGALAVIIDTKTLTTRSFPMAGCDPKIYGRTLVTGCLDLLELRELSTGELLPYTPVSPSPTEFDGFWDDSEFVGAVDFRGAIMRRIVHFGPELRSETLPLPPDEPCSGHRGTVSWSARPPYTICERRTGRVTGKIPVKAVRQDPWDGPELSSDGKLVVSGGEAPLLARIADGEATPLADAPTGLDFVGPDLLFGFDEGQGWGFWSGVTGRRLTRSSERLHEKPIAANLALGIAIEPDKELTLRDVATGKPLETLSVNRKGDIELDPRGLLTVVEPSRVSFFHVPRARRLGMLLNHPKTGEVAFLGEANAFEVSGSAKNFRDLLRCQVGLTEVPLDVCIDAFLEPGVAARTLLGPEPP